MTSSIYAHIWPTSNRLLGFNTYRTSYMYDLFILSNSYLRSKNSPIRTKGIQYIRASDLIQLFLPINSISTCISNMETLVRQELLPYFHFSLHTI